ncbi:hypothetical protein NMG60_11015278 [Bertholletia excelsa]
MSELGGGESLLWETESWALSNSDNSGCGGDEKPGEKPRDSGSNAQTLTGKEMAAPGRKKRNEKGEVERKKVNESDDHEIHIWTERERRKKMRNMFSNLHALLPQLPPKADKSTIVDEAVNYIKSLQQTLQKLQRQKLERFQGANAATAFDPTSMITHHKLSVDSREAFMADQVSASSSSVMAVPNNSSSSSLSAIPRFPPQFRTWTSSNVILNVCGDQAHINVCSPRKPGLFTAICFVLEKHKIDLVYALVSSDQNRTIYMIQARARTAPDQLPEAFPVEEIYKQAVAEIMMWVSA